MATEKPIIGDGIISETIENNHPLFLIVGDKTLSPCDHAVFRKFQIWVVNALTDGELESYIEGNVRIDHWDEKAGSKYPHLLNPCECGTYLPIEVDPNPMFSSAIGLLAELNEIRDGATEIPEKYRALVDGMIELAQLGINTQCPMEIR